MATAVKSRKDSKKAREELGVDEARQQWGHLINRVGSGGGSVVLTRHGMPVVALVSIADLEKIEAA